MRRIVKRRKEEGQVGYEKEWSSIGEVEDEDDGTDGMRWREWAA